ncbi:MAG: RNA methyltransferase [Anaerolineaceae bacterium]|nr:RNA methyltransferase [Anaerolineaceae bacterium]
MSEIISSAQNSRVQLVHKLMGQSKARRKEGLFVAEGPRLVEDGLHSAFPLEFMFYRAHRSARSQALLAAFPPKTPCLELEDKLYDCLSDTENSQGVLAVFRLTDLPLPDRLDFVLIPDQLRDPGNLGTIIRSAEAAGVQALLLPPGTVDPWSPKVVRSGMGSHFRLPIYEWNWQAIAEMMEGLTLYGAEMNGNFVYWQADFRQPTALLVGGEAEGISPQARSLLKQTLRIPMAGQNESLNAAVSASILAFEVLRQRST